MARKKRVCIRKKRYSNGRMGCAKYRSSSSSKKTTRRRRRRRK